MDRVVETDLDTGAVLTLAGEFIQMNKEDLRIREKISASSVGSCPRSIGHGLLGSVKQPWQAHQLFTFWQGHALGDAMTLMLIRMGWVDAEPFINDRGQLDFKGNTEERVEDDLFVGHYDIFTNPLKHTTVDQDGRMIPIVVPTDKDDPEGKRYLLDFKTMTDRIKPMWKKDANGKAIREKKISKKGVPYYSTQGCAFPGDFTRLCGFPQEYWEQLHIYARIKKADGLMLVVMARDASQDLLYRDPDNLLNFPVKVFTTTSLDQQTLDDLDKKAQNIYSYTQQGNLPPVPEEYGADKFPCTYCSYQHQCFPDQYAKKPELIEIMPALVSGISRGG